MKIPYLREKEFRKLLKKNNLMSFRIVTAIGIVNKYFSNKKRDDGTRCIEEHIFPVAYEVATFFKKYHKVTDEIIISALFHDLLEETDIHPNDLVTYFPHIYKKILKIILPLTKEKLVSKLTYNQKFEYNKRYFRILYSSSYETKIIKIMDRINNLSCIHKTNYEKRKFYLFETLQFYLPFARNTNRLLYAELLDIYKKQERIMKRFEKRV